MKMNLQLFGGRGASSGKRVSGGGGFSPIDIENTNLSDKQLKALCHFMSYSNSFNGMIKSLRQFKMF